MKTNQFFFAATCLFFLGNCTLLNAQKLSYWKGGTPGMESNWNCPKNWSNAKVPDGFSDVIIPDVSSGSGCYPTLKDRGLEVNSLTLQSGTSLNIEKQGTLIVFTTLDQFGQSELELKGVIQVFGQTYAGIRDFNTKDAISLMDFHSK